MTRWATFDCYGTLIDWDAGIGAELNRLFGDAALLGRYREVEPEVQREEPSRSYREAMAPTLELPTLAALPETLEALVPS